MGSLLLTKSIHRGINFSEIERKLDENVRFERTGANGFFAQNSDIDSPITNERS
ncbi:hypothetical protein LEP1GSC017_0402 [Leptospira meyeri serovar Hardjo str. Went 5]|nr:hypothetical protein LEP1GSC017_0402 [Leptospira meyeri serovar Hardjo str. Went 5]